MVLAVDKNLSAAKIHQKHIVLAIDNEFYFNKLSSYVIGMIIFLPQEH